MACPIYSLGMLGDSGYIHIYRTHIKAHFHRAFLQHGMPHLSSCGAEPDSPTRVHCSGQTQPLICVTITHSSHLWLGRLCGFVDARLRIGSDTREIEVGARRGLEGMECHLPDLLVGRC
ncbi:unnamed protein product [Tuber melanosporum]|uniref:(Perigord truffle) hypothetical protein n=1 Tax=Tuber melanosporum (strain Mel28) TaxID=656061 RepID=D5GP30_TUBMM|nr:uncharacterized protein GSTUM_00011640001 [Tuber melanosporum]CAZ86273.1 unnamed protein product [Tuber melanosporum]